MTNDSAPDIRFAIRLPQAYCVASPEGLLAVAAAAEEAGIWGVSVQDHIIANSGVSFCGAAHDHAGDDRIFFEALQTLAFVTGQTQRIKLITTVLVTPFRNAILLAKEIAALDVFSNGRVVVGTGVGAPRRPRLDEDGGQNLSAHAAVGRQEFDAFNLLGHRGRLADESLQVMDAIWTQDSATFHGDYYNFDDLAVYPKPRQRPRPPFWVGGRAEASRRRAVTLGDAWCPSQISAPVYKDGITWMQHYARDHGLALPRDNAVNLFAVLDESDDRARQTNQRTFGHRFSEDGLAAVTLAGDPDSFIRQARAFVDAGVNVFDLKLIPPTVDETIRALGLLQAEVIPAFST